MHNCKPHPLAFLVSSDLYRISGKTGLAQLFKQVTLGESFKYIFWMRICNHLAKKKIQKYTTLPIARAILNHYKYKLGISIPYNTQIGPGFSIGHFGCIVINDKCTIGSNLTISHGVTIGKSNRGTKKGYPAIGDCVYIGPGAKIIGNIRIGHNAAIGANCVVTSDVPDNAVMIGNPAKIISSKGSLGYVNNTDYQTILANHD